MERRHAYLLVLSKVERLTFCRKPHSTIYSATTFLEKCKKGVREKWFEKSGSKKVVDQKKVVLYYKSTFFLVREKGLTRKKGGFIL